MKFKPKCSKVIYRFPKSLQRSIPISEILENGVFRHGGEYSVCLEFTDTNYQSCSIPDKELKFKGWESVIKSADIECHWKLVLVNSRVNKERIIEEISIPHSGDGLDEMRDEMNAINKKRAIDGRNAIIKRRFLVLTVKRKPWDVQHYFNRLVSALQTSFAQIGSALRRLTSFERLEFLHDFFNPDKIGGFDMDIAHERRRGHDLMDNIIPKRLDFPHGNEHCQIGDKYARSLVLDKYPSELRDDIFSEILEYPKEIVIAFDFIQKSTEESKKAAEDRLMVLDSEIQRSTEKASKAGDFNHQLTHDQKHRRESLEEILELICSFDQRLGLGQVTLLHLADSLNGLNHDTAEIKAIGSRKSCGFETLVHQQEQGLNTVLPYGLRYVDALKTYSTENAAILLPFCTEELNDKGGQIFGVNQISHNLIRIDRRSENYDNGHMFIVGTTGSGKSVFNKLDIFVVRCSIGEQLIVFDVDSEYEDSIIAMGGNYFSVSSGSPYFWNLFDMDFKNATEKDVAYKSDFLCRSIGAGIQDSRIFGAIQKSIVDTFARELISEKQKRPELPTPTLCDLQKRIGTVERGKDLAIAMERFTTGSLSMFAKQTNIKTDAPILGIGLRDLSGDLKGVGYYNVLESMSNTVINNSFEGKGTRIIAEELSTLSKDRTISSGLDEAFRRYRKFGGIMTAVSQNVSQLLENPDTAAMLSLSEICVMLNQSHGNRKKLQEMFSLSDSQVKYITNARKGTGLIRCKNAIVPFDATIPTDSKLFAAVDTTLRKGVVKDGQKRTGAF